MKIKDAAKLMNTYAELYPEYNVTFANNKVPVNIIVFDEKSKTINIR